MSEKISITKDAMKAEAKIRRIRLSATVAIGNATLAGEKKEFDYVSTLTPEVRAVLVAAGVLETRLSADSGEYIDIESTLLEEPGSTGSYGADGIFEGSGQGVPLTEVLNGRGLEES